MTTDSTGLRWSKVDLHFHTPGSSEDYLDKSVTPTAIIAKAQEVGLAGFAVTDHNTGRWIDDLKEASSGTGVAVFPGVEVTVMAGKRNIHVLAIFDPSRGTEHVHDFLTSVGITQDKRGKTDTLADGDVNQVIGAIVEFGGVPLLAHADSSSGVLDDMGGQARINVIRNPKLLGVEIKNSQTAQYLDGTDPNYKRKLAVFMGSDCHALDQIGRRASYFKLGSMTVGALRQCFYDQDTRIRVSDQPKAQYPTIVAMEVKGGFFDGVEFTFHEGLNAILGGKGVGKSLVVEFLRFALCQPSDVDDIGEDAKSKVLRQLGQGGSVTVRFRQPSGTTYAIKRTLDSAQNPVEVIDLATKHPYEGDVSKLVPILAYSQNEVIYISRRSDIQLLLIDRMLDTEPHQLAISGIKNQLRTNADQYLRALSARERAEQTRQDIATLEAKVKELNAKLNHKIFEEQKEWTSQGSLIQGIGEAADTAADHVRESQENLADVQLSDLAQEDSPDADLKRYHDEVAGALKQMQQDISIAMSGFDERLGNAKTAREAWEKRRAAWAEGFNKFLEEIGGEQGGPSAEREKIAERIEERKRTLHVDETTAAGFKTHGDERERLLDQLDEAAYTLYEKRNEVYEDLTNKSESRLQLTLGRNQNRSSYDRELERLFRGLSVQRQYRAALVQQMPPRGFVDAVLAKDHERLVDEGGLTSTTATRIVDSLSSNEDLFHSLLLLPFEHAPEDEPGILYQKDDGAYYPLGELSVGQKCTALIMIALSEGSMPILIDQPEDALDVATIYADVVQRLREGKDQRQFIVTTHNPNVAVSSDSDKYHVLRATASRGELICAGAIDLDHVANEVITHLEGGVDPYTLRGLKYNVS